MHDAEIYTQPHFQLYHLSRYELRMILQISGYLYFRNINLHPICLPDWERQDSEGKYTYDKLYRYNKWEKYQVLYSLKAMHKDVRFYNVWTDVNGPSKFMVKTVLPTVLIISPKNVDLLILRNVVIPQTKRPIGKHIAMWILIK